MIKTFSINDIIKERNSINAYKWQRKFNWNEIRVEKLFRSIFDNNSIGTILVTENHTKIESIKIGYDYKIAHNNPHYLIIDGFQRLFTIIMYISDDDFADKKLYFNKLYGINREIPFKLFKDKPRPETYYDRLFGVDVTKELADNEIWIPVKELFSKLLLPTNTYQKVAKAYNPNNLPIVNENIFKFYYHFLYSKKIVFIVNNNNINDLDYIKNFYKNYKDCGVKLSKEDIIKCLFQSLGGNLYWTYKRYLEDATELITKYQTVKHFIRNRSSFHTDFAVKLFVLCCSKSVKWTELSIEQYINFLIDNANIVKSFWQDDQSSILLKKCFEWCLKICHITSIPITDAKCADIIISIYTQIKENENFILFEFLLKYIKAQLCKYFINDNDVDLFAYFMIKYVMHKDIKEQYCPLNLDHRITYYFSIDNIYGDECDFEKKMIFSDFSKIDINSKKIDKNTIKIEWDKREQEINIFLQ